ncbi:hypothetical protein AYY19_18740 [Photobacterium aquimaris]|uniref:DUF2884 domain-containing protein n=1 Tax=Photobacterium aquimaris TaxID=512643 RepID=A0A2T3IGV2_9GAMM|nr:DUF2884 family protein [Photobacterium aquimaris]OBU14553.1 hypothetical protein AYY19_18740 [Photobacterium aquimaris]OBU16829.1 hypothetical protein AYY20_19450 [Photobacterium aquimaris]PSU26383.1 DUF2884 domain-containing protein [Photobacterium aquimaris]PSV96678.1 DUF2884 domain-containing protein [Photobacterium aquimaris]
MRLKTIMSTIGSSGLMLLFSSTLIAGECEPQWHNSVSISDDKLTLSQSKQTFVIKDDGQLYFDIHKVKLDPDQTQLLVQYYQTINNDLPYLLSHGQHVNTKVCQFVNLRMQQERQIRQHIPALKSWESVNLL